MTNATRKQKRILRHTRIRAKIVGTEVRPRLVVFRSNKRMYAQLVDDQKGRVLAASAGKQAKAVAKDIAEKAKTSNVEKIVFDRGGYKYHGHVKVLAEELRAQGMKF